MDAKGVAAALKQIRNFSIWRDPMMDRQDQSLKKHTRDSKDVLLISRTALNALCVTSP